MWPANRRSSEIEPRMAGMVNHARPPRKGWGGNPPHPPGYTHAVAGRDEIVAFCSSHLEAAEYPDQLPVGLQVPGAEEVTTIVSGVTASLELFRRAAEQDAQMVLVHHGMFWGSGPRPPVSPREKARLRCLFDHDLSLVAYHLALDAHPEIGNNAILCRILGLDDREPFGGPGPRTIGFIGSLRPPVTIDELVERVRRHINPEPLVFREGPGEVGRVAVISGSAAGEALAAADAGADCFLTGEPREAFGVKALGDLLAERFGVEHRFVDIANPV